MANMIARLGVVLGLDNAEFVKGIDAASRKLEQFADAASKYGKIGAAALTAASVAALQYADDIADVAKANDLAVDSVVKLSKALMLSGGKADDAGKLLAGFTNFVDKAASGGLEAQKSFQKIGVGLKDLGQLSTDELMGKTLRALSEIEDPITRNAKAMEVFGRAARGVDMRELLAQMESGATLSAAQADGIAKAAEAFDDLAKAASDMKMTLAAELGPVLKTTLDYIKDMKGETNLLGEIFKTVFQTIAVLGANVAFVIRGIFYSLRYDYDKAKELSEKARLELDQFERRVMGTGDGRRGMDDPRVLGAIPGGASRPRRQVTAAKDPEAERAARERERLEKYFRGLQKQGLEDWQQTNKEVAENISRIEWLGEKMRVVQELEGKRLQLNQRLFEIDTNSERLRQEEVNYRKEVAQIEFDHARKLEEIQDSEMSLADKQRARQTEEEQRLQRLTLAYAKMNAEIEKRQGSFSQGFVQKMGDFFRDMPTQLELGAQAFESVFSNMTSALDNFVKTGKLSFKDLARSIIQDLLRIQLQAQISGLLSMFFRGGSAVSSQFSLASGATGGLGLKLPGRASGGTVSGDTPYLVGERGPELFVPRNSGSVIPSGAMSSSMGGVTNITNNYIDAIDVQSFEQRILNSSNTIWAANQYANKSLAVAGGRA